MTNVDLIQKIGPVIMEMRDPILNYNEAYFRSGLPDLISKIDSNPDKLRDEFFKLTTEQMRTRILDASNILLILYARYLTYVKGK